MKITILGSGMMGRAIAHDLCKFSDFDRINIIDKNNKSLNLTRKFLKNSTVDYTNLDIENTTAIKKHLEKYDVVISAIHYKFNYDLAKIAIESKTHFLDLGGNTEIVLKEKTMDKKANKMDVVIIPDCGLAPGVTSVITRDITEKMDLVNYVKIRVGGLPIEPKPPFNYQIVFSPYGLINEYIEDATVLNNGKIIKKKSMTEIEKLIFPKPFGEMEAFITSGGSSTLPYTYKDKIKYLDYKTIRYPGHCEKFKLFLDMGLGDRKTITINNQKVIPRDLFVKLLLKKIPDIGKDVVLLKVICEGIRNYKNKYLEYSMIDYYEDNSISAMMRTTGYPVSITAQMIERGVIKKRGVFCSEEIIPCKLFFKELKKRDINIKIEEK